MTAVKSLLAVLLLVVLLPDSYGQTVTTPQRGAVRLVRNGLTSPTGSYTSGRVQIYLSGTWGHICDDLQFSLNEASVICHQLGYSGASTYSNRQSDSWGLMSGVSMVLDDVDCSSSTYLVILQCGFSTIIDSNCVPNRDEVSVTCFSTRLWSSPYDGQIRLTGAELTNQGLVEVYCNGQWGTICDNGFDQTDANTVCRQQGYTNAARYDHLTFRGTSSQPIWFTSVFCPLTTYSCLRSCATCRSSPITGCSHSEDITVECEYSSSLSSSTRTTSCNFGTSTPTSPTSFTSFTISPGTTSSITGIIVGVIILSLVCTILPILIPVCICCCLGVGICGASRNRGPSSRIVTTTAAPPPSTTIVTSSSTQQKVDYPTGAYPSQPSYTQPPPPAYAAQPPAPYPTQQAAYPAQPPAAYPAQPYPGYPPQEGYPDHAYPPPPDTAEPPPYGGGAAYPPATYPAAPYPQ